MKIPDIIDLGDLDGISEAVSKEFEDVDCVEGESLDAVGEEASDDLRFGQVKCGESLLLKVDHLFPVEEGADRHDGNVLQVKLAEEDLAFVTFLDIPGVGVG